MRRLLTVLLSLAFAVLALSFASCDGGLPSDPDVDVDAVAASFASASPVHLVTGKGFVWYDDPQYQYMNLEVNARATAEGARGVWHYQFRSREPGGRIMCRAICVAVSGNRAWLGGVAVQAGNPANVGKWFGLYVEDNGEGGDAPPDRLLSQWFGVNESMARDFCSQMPATEGRVVEGGNLQVH